jgi:hypothetical protein
MTKEVNTSILRQEHPLSPFLSILVAEVLGALLDKAKNKERIKDLMTHLIQEGITHIQYVDGIVVMVDPCDETIRNLKLILYCFEFLSGLKINFHKSDVFLFGAEPKEEMRWAHMLNCKIGSLTMTYLRISISDLLVRSSSFDNVVNKIS